MSKTYMFGPRKVMRHPRGGLISVPKPIAEKIVDKKVMVIVRTLD